MCCEQWRVAASLLCNSAASTIYAVLRGAASAQLILSAIQEQLVQLNSAHDVSDCALADQACARIRVIVMTNLAWAFLVQGRPDAAARAGCHTA